jgi:hypothetical protein
MNRPGNVRQQNHTASAMRTGTGGRQSLVLPDDCSAWRWPLAAGATDADRVLAGDAKLGPHE